MQRSFWDVVEPIARQHDVELFDIEAPKRAGGVLRVFIYRPRLKTAEKSEGGINVSDCAKVSRSILDLEEIERFMPGDTRLEVSSPGINRKLRRPEHFTGAVGERVRITFTEADANKSDAKRVTLKGELVSFDGTTLTLKPEASDERGEQGQLLKEILFRDVVEARVDFSFD